jgi:hypothetical protein
MRDTIDRAREAHKELVTKDYQGHIGQLDPWTLQLLKRFEALVRADAIADEREQGQRWFDAVTAQHKQLILAEREACAKLAQSTVCDTHIPTGVKIYGTAAAKAIRARGNT